VISFEASTGWNELLDALEDTRSSRAKELAAIHYRAEIEECIASLRGVARSKGGPSPLVIRMPLGPGGGSVPCRGGLALVTCGATRRNPGAPDSAPAWPSFILTPTAPGYTVRLIKRSGAATRERPAPGARLSWHQAERRGKAIPPVAPRRRRRANMAVKETEPTAVDQVTLGGQAEAK
jgi:hypothetical protein